MTQPARRTFLPGHVVVIICSLSTQVLKLAGKVDLEQYEVSYRKLATFFLLAYCFSATLSLAT